MDDFRNFNRIKELEEENRLLSEELYGVKIRLYIQDVSGGNGTMVPVEVAKKLNMPLDITKKLLKCGGRDEKWWSQFVKHI